jgi:hypothetical protein
LIPFATTKNKNNKSVSHIYLENNTIYTNHSPVSSFFLDFEIFTPTGWGERGAAFGRSETKDCNSKGYTEEIKGATAR